MEEQDIKRWVDKDTGMHIAYIQSLEISGYGETPEEANEMLQFNYNEWKKQLCPKCKIDISDTAYYQFGCWNCGHTPSYDDMIPTNPTKL